MKTTAAESIRTFRFEGHLDSTRCSKIEEDLLKSLAQTESHIVFDLAEVDMISSAFLRLCTKVRQKAGEHGFELVNVEPHIKEVFKLAGLDDMISK